MPWPRLPSNLRGAGAASSDSPSAPHSASAIDLHPCTLTKRCRRSVYNHCSGCSVSIGFVLQRFLCTQWLSRFVCSITSSAWAHAQEPEECLWVKQTQACEVEHRGVVWHCNQPAYHALSLEAPASPPLHPPQPSAIRVTYPYHLQRPAQLAHRLCMPHTLPAATNRYTLPWS